MQSKFWRFAGVLSILAGVAGFLYSLAFIVLKNDLLSALLLLLGGLSATAPLIALYLQSRDTDAPLALWGILFALAGAVGSAVHAGYDLSNAIHPPAVLNADLPSPVDPRGLATFGLAGIGLFVLAWLILRGHSFPASFGYIGYISATLMLLLYLGRLVVLQATSLLIAIPAVFEGFLVNPLWYIWLGMLLLRRK
jgi:hypothetical protein